MKNFILSIDQGTTSTRSILFDLKGKPVFVSQKEFKQYYPKDGWVEHNPEEIWVTTKKVIKEIINKNKKIKGNILTIGITNQRETTLLWDSKTGKCIYNAIVWQDRRTTNLCNKLKKKGLENLIKSRTGLLLDPYFSATKIKWIIENIPSAKKLLKKNRLLFGTIDTYLVWKLTKGKIHATDSTNASRTMLFNIKKNCWDKKILKLLKIPESILPNVKNSADNFGFTDKSITKKSYPINGVIGDQQAATVGQSCFQKGSTKITFGTGAFIIMNTGNNKINSKNKLLSTICYRINNRTTFALEGSIFIAGASVQWLRDKLKIIKSAKITEKISKKQINNNNVYLVPAFTGLGAPYWKPNVRGTLTGLTRDTGRNEIIRATLESVAYQTSDLLNAMKKDGLKPSVIKVDGGMANNYWFIQFLTDILNIKVLKPKVYETTSLGAAVMAGYYIGVYKSLSDITRNWRFDKKFVPKIVHKNRLKLLNGWHRAIRKTLR
ncbi:glycerol kinase GlpK [Candidatus Pelagibacter sp.]|nr:glycerol kinase GlpK [Candidatus Pelagibacter sp.]